MPVVARYLDLRVVAVVALMTAQTMWRATRFDGATRAAWVADACRDPYILCYLLVPLLAMWSLRRRHSRSAGFFLLRHGSWRRVVTAILKDAARAALTLQGLQLLLAVLTCTRLPAGSLTAWWEAGEAVVLPAIGLWALSVVFQVAATLMPSMPSVVCAALVTVAVIADFKLGQVRNAFSPSIAFVVPAEPPLISTGAAVVCQGLLVAAAVMTLAGFIDTGWQLSWPSLLVGAVPLALIALHAGTRSHDATESFSTLWQGIGHHEPHVVNYFALMALTLSPSIGWALRWDASISSTAAWTFLRSGNGWRWFLHTWWRGTVMGSGGYLLILAASGCLALLTAQSATPWPRELGSPVDTAVRLLVLAPLGISFFVALLMVIRMALGSTSATAGAMGFVLVLGLFTAPAGAPVAQGSLLLGVADPVGLWLRLAISAISLAIAIVVGCTSTAFLARSGFTGGLR